MKRTIILALALIALVLTSCKKDPIGGTAVQAASGQWDVSRYFVTTDGSLEEPLWMTDGVNIYTFANRFMMLTYNNNTNDADKLYLDDLGYYYSWYIEDYDLTIPLHMEFKVLANLDLNALTFSVAEAEDEYEGIPITDLKGGIIKDGAKKASGLPRDSIWVSFKINDPDLDAYIADPEEGLGLDNFDHFLITGVRHTGFEKDN